MKRILGLDLGTNSIGWALVEIDHDVRILRIIGLGSRILPMDAGEIGDFESKGVIKSATAQRTGFRGPRKLNERFILRRDRLHLVLNLLQALPKHYSIHLDFERDGKRSGQFKENKEPKIAYQSTENDHFHFYYEDAFNEMIKDLQKVNPNIKNEKGYRVPKDWTLYYLRQKALKEKISLEEFAWVLLSYNQKRGYEKLEVESKNEKENEIEEHLELEVEKVKAKQDQKGKYYEIQLMGVDEFSYKEYSNKQLTEVGDIKELVKVSNIDSEGNVDKKKTKYTITDIYSLEVVDTLYEKTDNKNTPHQYTIKFNSGWENVVSKKKYTSQYQKIEGHSFDYIIRTDFDTNGNIKQQQGKDRAIREPDYSDTSNDWTLLKKKTEKEAIQFNVTNGYVDAKTDSVKKFVSPKIYDVLKNDTKTGKRTKIIGGMFQVVERQFYREELNQIVKIQRKYHSNLEDRKVFEDCVKLLYPNNKSHAKNLLRNKNAIQNLLVEDVLLYQRDLKSKKSEISDCKYEVRHWEKTGKKIVDKITEEIIDEIIPHYHKVVLVSHPLFQEFRIWDKIHNLKLIEVEKGSGNEKRTNEDVTKDYFKTEDDWQALLDLFYNRKVVNQKLFIDFCSKRFNINKANFVWNYPEDEELKGNETRVSFAFRFKRCGFTNYEEFLTQEKEIALWHYLYSVNFKERTENNNTSIRNFFKKLFVDFELDETILEKIIIDFANYPKFDSRYGAFSEKALKKLLPFIRLSDKKFEGKFEIPEEFEKHLTAIEYKKENIPSYLKLSKEHQQKRTKEERKKIEALKRKIYKALWQDLINKRIDEILTRLSKIDFDQEIINYKDVIKTEVNEYKGELAFPKGLFNAFRDFKEREKFSGLNLTQASYLVYGRHSELAKAKFWRSPQQIRGEIHTELKQHSLNNPVAERVLFEMIQVVADIWEYYGNGKEKFFTSIHLEVGRELKKSAKEKKEYDDQLKGNREQNKRLRNILKDFLDDRKTTKKYNAIVNSSDHFERLKIVEDTAQHQIYHKDYFKNKSYSKKQIEDILKETKISPKQFEKYKLWVEQGYVSPYTNKPIQLSDLFDGSKYNIDHIFPQALVTNDSLNNKVVCETEVNKLKKNLTGREFILKYAGQKKIIDDEGKKINHKIIDDDTYVSIVKSKFSKNKRFILLAKEIPPSFTSSQLNNARHIARKAMELLSHIVREPGEVEFRSKNLLPVAGRITSELKQAWRLNEVWRELLSPRFKRLNELTQSNLFGSEQVSKSGHPYFDCNLHESIREKNENYDIKRLDHRHHALDALIIALCTREHVNYINNINAGTNPKKKNSKKKIAQIQAQRTRLKQQLMYCVPQKGNPNEKRWIYFNPGEFHDKEVEGYGYNSVVKVDFEFKENKGYYKNIILSALENIIVTFKREKSPIRKTSNKYMSYYDENGNLRKDKNSNPIKKVTKQIDVNTKNYNSTNKKNIAVRKGMHDEQPYGKTELNFEVLDISKNLKKRHLIYDEDLVVKIEDEFARCDDDETKTQKSLAKNPIQDDNGKPITHTAFKLEKKKLFYTIRKPLSKIENEKHIRKVADRILQDQLRKHVAKYETYKEAFSPIGIEQFNKDRKVPVKKVTLAEGGSGRYLLGNKKSKSKNKKFVKGVNHCFVIDRKKRKYYTISLKKIIENYSREINFNEEMKNETSEKFYLSAGELVYFPTEEQFNEPTKFTLDMIDLNRIYKFVNSSDGTANFSPFRISSVIYDFDKKSDEGKKMIKVLETMSKTSMKILSPQKTRGNVYLENEIGMATRQNKNPNDLKEYKSIKERCWKLKTDRLGNIAEIIK